MARYVEGLERYRAGRFERHFRRLCDRYEAEGAEDRVCRRTVPDALSGLYGEAFPRGTADRAWVSPRLYLDQGGIAELRAGAGGAEALGASQEASAAAAAGDDAVPEPALAKAGDGSTHEWLAGQPELDLIPGSSPGTTLEDATSEIYSAILVAEKGTASSFMGLHEGIAAKGLFSSLYTDRGSHYFLTPKAGGKVDRVTLTPAGRALAELKIEHIPSCSPGSTRPHGAGIRHLAAAAAASAAAGRHHHDRGGQPVSPGGLHRRPQPPLRGHRGRRGQRLRAVPWRAGRYPVHPPQRWSATTTACATRAGGCRSPSSAIAGILCKRPFRCTNTPTARSRSSMARGG